MQLSSLSISLVTVVSLILAIALSKIEELKLNVLEFFSAVPLKDMKRLMNSSDNFGTNLKST